MPRSPYTLAPGYTFASLDDEYDPNDTDLVRAGYPLGDEDPVRVLMAGDSMTNDPVRARHVQRFVRMLTRGVQFVGTIGLGAATGGIVGDQEMQYWTRDGVNGDTIAQILARIPTIATALGASRVPHIVDLLMGANDISALRTIAQIEADARAVIAACRAAWPDCWIILNAPADFTAGAGAGFETKSARRGQVVGLYETLAASIERVVYVDGLVGMTAAEQLSDGVHLNDAGAARTARAEADAIVRIAGRRLPTIAQAAFSPANNAALVFDTAASDAGTINSDADLAAGTDSFAFSIRFSLDAFPPDGSIYTIVSQGATIPDGYTLGVFKVAGVAKAGVSFYLVNNQAVIVGNAGYPDALLELAKEHEIFILCDAAEDKVYFGLNGRTVIHSVDLVALGRGADWNIAASAVKFGRNVLNGIQGRIRRFQFLKGSSVPSIWDAPRYCEELYHLGSLLPGNPLLYMMNERTGSPAEQQGRAPTVTLSGVTWGNIL